MVSALVPLGFAAISALPRLLAENARSTASWNLQAAFDPKDLTPWIERVVGEDGEVSQITHYGSDWHFITELGQRLASGAIEAHAIIADTGELVRTTPEDWRRPIMDDQKPVAPVVAVRDGVLLPLVRPNSPTVMALPIIALHDLAVAFGATAPPPRPDPQLLDCSGPQPSPTTPAAQLRALRAQYWMQGFAIGCLEGKGDKAKQEDALTRCRKATGCNVREAREAWKAIPAALKRPPRSSPGAEMDGE